MGEGLSRRDMIKGAAVAGAAAWTAPMIIDSLTSPAAAGSVPLATGISHIDVVFTITAGNTCSLTAGLYEAYWDPTNGWAAPGVGNRCMATCGSTSVGSSTCLNTALTGIPGLVSTDSCGCILLDTSMLPSWASTSVNDARTFCGNTTFNTNGGSKCAMPCTGSATIIKFCCAANACCSGSVASANCS